MNLPLDILKLDLFAGMAESEADRLFSHPGWVEKNYAAEALLQTSGGSLHSLMILTRGRVEGSISSSEGQLLRLETLTAPATIAPAYVFGDAPAFLSIRAVEKSQVLQMARKVLLDLFHEHPILLKNYLENCADRFLYLSKKLTILSFHSIRKKLAVFLLEQAARHGESFRLNQSITALAEYMGVERPSLSAVFNDMIREGLFHRDGKTIVIDDRSALEHVI